MGEKFSILSKLGLSKRDLEMAERYGGCDYETWVEFERPDTISYFDKGGHKERSIANQPNHLKHWKKR